MWSASFLIVLLHRSRKEKAAPVLTVVKAPELIYTGKEKVAHYKGGVLLERPGMEVRSNEFRAFMKEEKDGTTLDRAFADGNVRILEKAADRTRTGTGEHGEYYVERGETCALGRLAIAGRQRPGLNPRQGIDLLCQ